MRARARVQHYTNSAAAAYALRSTEHTTTCYILLSVSVCVAHAETSHTFNIMLDGSGGGGGVDADDDGVGSHAEIVSNNAQRVCTRASRTLTDIVAGTYTTYTTLSPAERQALRHSVCAENSARLTLLERARARSWGEFLGWRPGVSCRSVPA